MKKYVFLFMISSFMMPSYVYAADIECKALPSCEDMGYLYTKSDCVNMPRLKCPFDLNKYYCKKTAQKDCQIGDRYMIDNREGTWGCTVSGEGGYILLGKTSNRCRLYPFNNGTQIQIPRRDIFCMATKKTRYQMTNISLNHTGIPLFDLLTICRKGIGLTESTQHEVFSSTCAVPKDYPVCVNLANCTIDYYQGASPAADNTSTVYPCTGFATSKIVQTDVGDCHTDAGVPNGAPTAKEMVKSTCVPGTYRRAGASDATFCLSKPVFSTDLIVSIPDGFLEDGNYEVSYIDMAENKNNAFLHPAAQFMNAENTQKLEGSGRRLPTFDELIILLKNLYDNGTIDAFMVTKGLTGNNVFLSHDGNDPNNGYSCLRFDTVDPYNITTIKPEIGTCLGITGTYFSVIGVEEDDFDLNSDFSDIEQ